MITKYCFDSIRELTGIIAISKSQKIQLLELNELGQLVQCRCIHLRNIQQTSTCRKTRQKCCGLETDTGRFIAQIDPIKRLMEIGEVSSISRESVSKNLRDIPWKEYLSRLLKSLNNKNSKCVLQNDFQEFSARTETLFKENSYKNRKNEQSTMVYKPNLCELQKCVFNTGCAYIQRHIWTRRIKSNKRRV